MHGQTSSPISICDFKLWLTVQQGGENLWPVEYMSPEVTDWQVSLVVFHH